MTTILLLIRMAAALVGVLIERRPLTHEDRFGVPQGDRKEALVG